MHRGAKHQGHSEVRNATAPNALNIVNHARLCDTKN